MNHVACAGEVDATNVRELSKPFRFIHRMKAVFAPADEQHRLCIRAQERAEDSD